MKAALVRLVHQPATQQQQDTPVAVSNSEKVVQFPHKETDTDTYLESYRELFAMLDEWAPKDLLHLVLRNKTCVSYNSLSLQIEQTSSWYEFVREVEVPDQFGEVAVFIAEKSAELQKLAAKGPTHFKKNYGQEVLGPVYAAPYARLLRAVVRATSLFEEHYGDFLRELGVLPPLPLTKNPAT